LLIRRSNGNNTTRASVVAFTLLVLIAGCVHAFAEAASANKDKAVTVTDQPAPIEFMNRQIAVLRSNLAGATPEDRAQRAEQRLDELPLRIRSKDIEVRDISVEDEQGLAFTYEGKVVFFLGKGDLDKESGETLASASKAALQALDEALVAREEERHWPTIRKGILFTLLGLAMLAVFLWLVWRAYHVVFSYLCRVERTFPYQPRLYGVNLVPHIAGLVYLLLRIVTWLLTIGSIYAWLTISLGLFPYTQPWGRQLGGYVFRFVGNLGIAAVNSLPGVFSCIVIFLITRWVVRLGKAFFLQVARGNIRLSWMDPDIAHATQRIFSFVAWVFAAVVAYPYIPGSSTEAFKGISVFFGLVVSLGSTGIINQVMSGLFVVYSKALKTGDWVVVNGKQGEVLEVGLLAVKIRTIEQQEVTIPNSVIVNTDTTNFTLHDELLPKSIASVNVTIGYDAPWRQVHALLLLGAERTANVLKAPEPYVVQRALSDFYVEYTLVAQLASEKLRVETLSALHANVQDAFNEYGVQIMSPHFRAQPVDSIVVPRSKWYAAPAAADNGQPLPGSGEGPKHVEAGKS
jgi:small-conductance mechanosensitive channel